MMVCPSDTEGLLKNVHAVEVERSVQGPAVAFAYCNVNIVPAGRGKPASPTFIRRRTALPAEGTAGAASCSARGVTGVSPLIFSYHS